MSSLVTSWRQSCHHNAVARELSDAAAAEFGGVRRPLVGCPWELHRRAPLGTDPARSVYNSTNTALVNRAELTGRLHRSFLMGSVNFSYLISNSGKAIYNAFATLSVS